MDYDEVIDVRGLAYRLCAEFGRADDAATMDALRGPMNLAYRTASEAVWSDPDNAAHVRGHGLSASWVSSGRQGEANPYLKGMASAEFAGRAMPSVIDAGQRVGVTESSCGNCGHVRSCHEDDECWADITPVGEGSYEQCPCGWWDDPDASEPPRHGEQSSRQRRGTGRGVKRSTHRGGLCAVDATVSGRLALVDAISDGFPA
jgi:hypothetical protein